MPEQVVNFCNSIMNAAGIFLGFSIASYIAVFLEYIKELVKRNSEEVQTSIQKEDSKKYFRNICILVAFLFLLTLILVISITSIQVVLAEDMSNLEVDEKLITTMQCASILYVVAVIVTAVGMAFLPFISIVVVKFSSSQKNR